MSIMLSYSFWFLYVLFFLFIILFAVQAYYVCTLILNYRMRKKRFLFGEISLILHISMLAYMSIAVITDKQYGNVDINFAFILLNITAIVAIIHYFILAVLKSEFSLSALICVFLSIPLLSNVIGNYYIFSLFISIVVLFFRLYKLYKEEDFDQKTELDAFSIKEGLDTLPTGVMFCDEEGYIYLTNAKMLELFLKFTGKEHFNSNDFWQNLIEPTLENVESQDVEGDILIHNGNETWRFSKKSFTIKKERYFEITAINVTLSIGALYTLEEEREKLEQQNIEMRKLIKSMETLRREKEYARIRSQVHDVLSQRLTAIQRMSQSENFTDYATLLSLSKDSIEHIKAKQGGDAKELYGEIYFYYRKIGLNIELLDELPEEEDIAFLFLSVLREACTNSIKHAGSTIVYVNIDKTPSAYRIEITNNGEKPEHGLIEGGGLYGIRSRVENAGGTLKVELIPEFSLIIKIGRGEKND